MKGKLFLLNFMLMIPCLLVPMSMPVSFVAVLALIVSMVNVYFSESKKQLLGYNSIILICVVTGLVLDYLERKSYGVGFHPEVAKEYKLLIIISLCGFLMITGAELILKHFCDKRK